MRHDIQGAPPPRGFSTEIRRARRGAASRGFETILLVEDDREVRNLADKILSQLGCRVIVAANAEEALLAAERHREYIHLLVSDGVMPGLSGRQLADRLADTHPETRVLYTSGYTQDAILHRGVLEQGIAFLSKPYTTRILGAKVREVLDPTGA